MKERAQGIVIGIVVTLALIGAISFASQHSEYIERVYRDIKITINGATIAPKDANGNDVEPFIIDGTTYLPVRAICNALGLQVTWDDETSTVEIIDDGMGRINAIYETTNKDGSDEASNVAVNTTYGIDSNNTSTSDSANTTPTLIGEPTEMQKKALEDAKKWIKQYSSIMGGASEKNTRNYLNNSGYLNSEIKYVMDNLRIDWKEQALKCAEKQINTYDKRDTLKSILKLVYGFTEEEAEYAANHEKFKDHWKRCAAKYANAYNPDFEYIKLDDGYGSVYTYKKTFEEYMKDYGYNDEEIAFAREELKYKQ